jgi:hypothetical protein
MPLFFWRILMAAYRSADATVAAHGAVAVTPSDSTTIPVTRSLYIGVAGDLAVVMADGQSVTFNEVAAGIFPIQVTKVMATNTLATDIVALY